MRRLIRVLLVLVVIVVVLVIAGRVYLHSQHLKDQVTSELQAAYGGAVHIDDVDVGLNSSSLSGVKLYEKGKENAQPPWASAQSVHTDVSVLGLLHGDTKPKNITLSGVAITLHFDKSGRLVTALPAPSTPAATTVGNLPSLRIERGRITLVRDGGAVLEFPNIEADLHRQGESFALDGTVGSADSQGWGKWTVHGSFGPKDEQVAITLQTDQPIHVTQAMMESLPFVPPAVWKEVQADAITPVVITLRYDLKDRDAHYRVDLHPTNTTVKLPAIDLDASAVKGEIFLDDSVVTLRHVEGKAFGGTIRADGKVVFSGKFTDVKVSSVAVQGLDMRRLPKSWGLPTQIEGQLKGSAWLEVVLGKGKPLTRGEGKAEIDNARVAGQPTSEPVLLELHARDGGFGFRSVDAATSRRRSPAEAERLVRDLLASDLVLLQAAPPDAGDLFAGVVNEAAAELQRLVDGTLRLGSAAVALIPEKVDLQQRKPQGPTRYVSVNLKMRKVDLALFAKGLGVKLPFPVGGRLTFQVKADIPLDTSGDLKTYRVNGTVTVADFTIADLTLDEVDATVHYLDGVLHLDSATARVSPLPPAGGGQTVAGTLKGRARMQLVPLGELSTDLTISEVPLSRLMSLLHEANAVQGTISGAATARVSASRLKAPDAWEVTANLTSSQLTVFGLGLRDSVADLRVKDGAATLTRVQTSLEGAPLTASAAIRLASPYPIKGDVKLFRWDLGSLQNLAPEVRPPVPIAGRFDATVKVQGTLVPLSVQTSGTADATALRLARVKFKKVHTQWTSDADRITLKEVQAALYQGEVTGSATVPLRPTAAGDINLRLRDLDVGALVKDLPTVPVKIEGKASGSLKGTVVAAAGKEPKVTMNLSLQAPHLRVQGIPTEQLQGTVDYRAGVIDYRLEGKALGGTFDVNGQLPPAAEPPAKPGKEGRLRLQGGKLSLLAGAFGQPAGTFPLRGRVAIDLRFRNEGAGFAPVGDGTLLLTDVGWGEATLTDRLQARVNLTGQELRLNNVSAIFAGGLLGVQLAINFRQPERSWISVSLERGDLSQLLAPWPDQARLLQGSLAVRLRGRLGREWHGSADLLVERGKIGGVEVTEWLLPLLWSYAPRTGSGELSLSDSSAQVARGRATAQAKASWGMGLRLEGQVGFANINLRTLSGQFSDSSQYVNGRLTGRFVFQGNNVRSVNDLQGTLRATLGDTQALQAPALQQVAPFIGLSASYTFKNGSLEARLDRGTLRIERLALQSDLARMFVEGGVTLAGRLDLDVTARTGPIGADFGGLRLLGLRVPLTGNIPLTVISEVSSYLSNRVIHLHVSGSVRSPSISIETGALLTQEAVRFFLNRSGLPVP